MKNLEEIRIKTILQERMNIFSLFKKGDHHHNEVVANISEVRFSDKDTPNSPIMRIMVGDKRFYMHKNLSRVQDFELLKAVLSPDVKKIECFK